MSATAPLLERDLGERFRDELEALITQGRIDESLKRLQDWVIGLAPGLKTQTIMVCARYNEFKAARRSGIIKSVETDPSIVAAIIELVDLAAGASKIKPELRLDAPPEAPITEVARRGRRRMRRNSEEDVGVMFSPPLAMFNPGDGGGTIKDIVATFEPLKTATIHPFPEITPPPEPNGAGETLSEFRKAYWSRFGSNQPPSKTVACIAEGISRSYKGTPFRLGEVSFTLRAGEITGVVGRNAAGKTTMLRMVLGELSPHSGRISYPMLTKAGSSWAHIKSQIAYVSQLPPRWPGRLRENLNFAASLAGSRGKENRDLVDWHMQRYGLTQFADYKWEEISGGYKIRFELVKALVSKPRMLVLDEPLANLDVMARQEFLTNLEAIATSFEQPVPILITSQHLYEIEAVADQMIILDGGKCIYSGPSGAIASIVRDRRIEVTMRGRQNAVAAALRPHGLTTIEATMEGFIFGFPKTRTATQLFELIGQTFPNRIVAMRDITSSARSLFRDEVDETPVKAPTDGRA